MDSTAICCTCLKNGTSMKSISSSIEISHEDRIAIANGNLSLVDDVNDTTKPYAITDLFDSFSNEVIDSSSLICDNCCTHLITTYLFKVQCERAFERLIEMQISVAKLPGTICSASEQPLLNKQEDRCGKLERREHVEKLLIQETFNREALNASVDASLQEECNPVIDTGHVETINLKIVESPVEDKQQTTDAFECDQCSKTFARVAHLKRHKLTHSDERPFVCDICEKRFRRADHLRIHKHHHSAIKPHKCEHCDKGFTRVEHVRRHTLARHSDRPPMTKEFVCSVCKRGFTTLKYLQTHSKSHTERTYYCKFCQMKFGTKSELAEHSKCHTNERPYLCSECGLRFVRKDYLLIHMRRHNNIKPYACKYCNKAFPRATDLTVHERYHTGEKSHLCTICGKGFHRAYNLVVHMRVHSGEKPYQCPHCVKCFAQGNDLKAHVRRHTGERYKCDICNAGFIQGYHLTQHKRNVHGIDSESHIRRVVKVNPVSVLTNRFENIAQNDQFIQVLATEGQHEKLYATTLHDPINVHHQIMHHQQL